MSEEISKIVDYLDSVIELMKLEGNLTREHEIARQKLEEAVFWLVYSEENE